MPTVLRDVRTGLVWSIAIAGGTPSIRSTAGRSADDVKADVLNALPPQRAGDIARQAGVITANNRWCEVDFLSFESIKVPKIHVLGDAIQIPSSRRRRSPRAAFARTCSTA